MKPTGIFERVTFTEARVARLESIILAQSKAIKALEDQLLEVATRRRAEIVADIETGGKLGGMKLSEPIARLGDIAANVAASHLLTVADLRGPSRQHHISKARQEAMLLMVQAGHTTTQIGRFLRRDHTTVSTGWRAARERVRLMEEGRHG